MLFHEVCDKIIADPSAPGTVKELAWAGKAMSDPVDIRAQALYMLSSIQYWRGMWAKTVRYELKLLVTR